MAGTLTDDEQFTATTFHVLDFETTTPRGYHPEPIEVAVVSLRVAGTELAETARLTRLMRPPAHAPVTAFDTAQTGITPRMMAAAPLAAEVLAWLDSQLCAAQPVLLVAHHAPAEAAVLYDYRQHCPYLAATHLLDTVRLARAVHPNLASHGLDALMTALGIPRPADRHRALADVQVTVQIFKHLIVAGAQAGLWSTLRQLRKAAGYQAKAAMPVQEALFH